MPDGRVKRTLEAARFLMGDSGPENVERAGNRCQMAAQKFEHGFSLGYRGLALLGGRCPYVFALYRSYGLPLPGRYGESKNAPVA
jgi:hypothetical protein